MHSIRSARVKLNNLQSLVVAAWSCTNLINGRILPILFVEVNLKHFGRSISQVGKIFSSSLRLSKQ